MLPGVPLPINFAFVRLGLVAVMIRIELDRNNFWLVRCIGYESTKNVQIALSQSDQSGGRSTMEHQNTCQDLTRHRCIIDQAFWRFMV